MPGIYRPRHPERTVLYRVLFHHFERFLFEYERRFQREYGYFRPVVREVVERYLDCGNPRLGFALMIRCRLMRTAKRCPDPLSRLQRETAVDVLLQDARLADLFGREALRLLVDRGLLSPEWAERILSWRHTGFNVHSRVRARTKAEAERVGKYMVRPVLALERLLFLEGESKVGYRHGPNGAELERMDDLEFIARVTSHIPDKGQVMVRYYGLYANAHRGKVRKASRVPVALGLVEEAPRPVPSKGWAEMIRKVYEVDPMICPRCGSPAVLMASMSAGG